MFDRLINLITLMTISVPEYFLAYVLIKYVAVDLGWFPSLANVTPDTGFGDRLYYAFLPMLTLVLVIVAHMMRMTRASVLSVMASPYIEMATLKGLTKSRIVVRHALPNALAPIISVIALNLAYLIVGVVVVETVFVYPGLGQLMVDEVVETRRAGRAGLRTDLRRHVYSLQHDRRHSRHSIQLRVCASRADGRVLPKRRNRATRKFETRHAHFRLQT